MEQDRFWNLLAKKLSGEATEADMVDLENLMRRNPDLHYPAESIVDLWRLKPPDSRVEATDAFTRHLARMESQGLSVDTPRSKPTGGIASRFLPSKARFSKWSSGNMFLWVAAALLLAGWLVSTIKPSTSVSPGTPAPEKSISEISTRNGSRTRLILPDSSIVWLNAGSKLSYDKSFGTQLREVSLSGEAFFDVTHNAEKPFLIHTAKMDIRVLGTRLNVRSYPSDRSAEASLLRGSVEITLRDRPNQKILLKPNEKIVVTNEPVLPAEKAARHSPGDANLPLVAIRSLTRLPADGSVAETSWIENKLTFQDESFAELATEMERWYGVTIHFDDSRRDTLHFTGSFEKETVQQALDELKMTRARADFDYLIQGSDITITK